MHRNLGLQKSKSTNIQGIVSGLLLVFITSILVEVWVQPLYFLVSILLICFALFLAKKTAKHFHVDHTHTGDSAIDVLAPIVLILVNIFHPAVDGFSFYETFIREGLVAATFFGGGIIVHEIFRQSAMVSVFKMHGTKWFWVVSTAILGIFLGFSAGFWGSTFFSKYEGVIEIITLFAYSFIVGESFYAGHTNKKSLSYVFVGVFIGIILTVFLKAH